MKQVIEGKVYDTSKAELLHYYSDGMPGDLEAVTESLYRTQNGAYFIAGEGGPATDYASQTGQREWTGGAGIHPLLRTEAIEWLEHCGASDVLLAEFEDELEQA